MSTSSEVDKHAYSLAHTARCKLHIAADRPDRDLRFVLGHAFTLDKVMLRVVEIEKESGEYHKADQDEKDVSEWAARVNAVRPSLASQGERRVSFQHASGRLGSFSGNARNRSPPAPPRQDTGSDNDDEDADDDRDDRLELEDDDSSDELSLRRFGSGAGRLPRLVDDESDGSDSDEDEEPTSPERMPSDAELRRICSGPESKELKGLYGDVKTCACHGPDVSAPEVHKVWEWPRKVGDKRIAVVQFEDDNELKTF